MLELYTLKVLKNQVPYLGRKWRSSKFIPCNTMVVVFVLISHLGNMRIITAIYLRCRPSLREEWMTGLESESDVDESAVSTGNTDDYLTASS